MKITFDTHGNDRQKDVARLWIDQVSEDIVYGGSKGSGKSYLGASLIFGDALLYPNTHYFISRKKLNDIRKYTIPTINEVFQDWELTTDYYNFNGQDNVYTLYNGSKVFLIEAKYLPSDPTYARFGSMQMTRGWIEEAGEFEVEAKNNLSASIGRWKNDEYSLVGKLLQTCNPSKNYLYKDYYKPNKEGSLPKEKRFVQAYPEDNKQLDSGYLERLNRTLSKNEKERLLKGNWEYDDDPSALCDYDAITDIFTNELKSSGQKYLTADIARMGSDKAIIAVWDDWNIIEFVVRDLSSMTTIQNDINTLRSKHSIPSRKCVADEDGIGGGVVDNCKIRGFVNNSTALDGENYFNLQSQCCYRLARQINTSQIRITADLSDKHREEIIEELEQLKSYHEDKDGKMRILPKEQIKQNIGRSPDWRDVLMMRCYFDVAPNKGHYKVAKK